MHHHVSKCTRTTKSEDRCGRTSLMASRVPSSGTKLGSLAPLSRQELRQEEPGSHKNVKRWVETLRPCYKQTSIGSAALAGGTPHPRPVTESHPRKAHI